MAIDTEIPTEQDYSFSEHAGDKVESVDPVVDQEQIQREIAGVTDAAAYFEFIERYGDDSLQYSFTQGTVNFMLERACRLAKDTNQPYLFFKFGFPTPGNRHGFERENVADMALKAAVQLISEHKYLEQVEQFLNGYLLQNPQMIQPELLYTSAANLNWLNYADYEPDNADWLGKINQDFRGWIAYNSLFMVGFEKYVDRLFRSSAESNNFTTLAKVIEYAPLVFAEAANQPYADHPPYDQVFQGFIDEMELIARESDNYFLRSRAEKALATMKAITSDYDSSPWVHFHPKPGHRPISPGLVGVFNRSGNLEQYFDDSEAAASEKPVTHNISELSPFIDRPDLSEKERASRLDDLVDFRFLMSQQMRTQVEDDFGIDLSQFDIRTQYYFLRFLKTKKMGEVSEVQDFVRKFGHDSLRVFLALDYGEQFGQKILGVAEHAREEQGKEFFRQFSAIIEKSDSLASAIEERFTDNPDFDSGLLANQISEAIIRRTKDFVSAAEFALDGQILFDELIQAMEQFSFVLGEFRKALFDMQSIYTLEQLNDDAISRYTTYILRDGENNYRVNVTIRPEESEVKIRSKEQGHENETKTVAAQPGIRMQFTWPDGSKFGFRIDLDPHYKDAEFTHGRLTLDIGNRESKIAEILSRVSPEHGHHTPQSFSPEFSDPVVFSRLCQALKDYLSSLPRA